VRVKAIIEEIPAADEWENDLVVERAVAYRAGCLAGWSAQWTRFMVMRDECIEVECATGQP
jgi:hypothetical protein